MGIKKHKQFFDQQFFNTRYLLLLLIQMLVLCACSGEAGNKAKQAGMPQGLPVPVTIDTVRQKAIPVEVRAIGNVEAYSTVSIKTQVTGALMRVFFTEGQEVKKGALLFIIDSRPLEAALKEAEANVARDLARAEKAKSDAGRYEKLYKGEVVSKDQYEQFRSNAESLEAIVQADRAAVENAKVQLGYCTIRSPLNGNTGSLLVHEGNVVKENETILVVINQVSPVYVNFSVPEQYLKEIEKYRAEGDLKVTAMPPGGTQPSQGVLTFVDNTVDTTTGTIRLKGTFENQERYLWPGQFVNVVLALFTQSNAITVPSQAIQTGQQGEYVFIVKPDQTVESRPVVVNRRAHGETVVEGGLKPGETVVTDGQLRLVPGAKVDVKRVPEEKEKHS